MNIKICAIVIVTILALIPCSLSISAQYIKPTNNSTNIEHTKSISNTLESAVIGGDVFGLIFDIQAYVICDGVDNDFHGVVWESTTPFGPGFKFSVPIPEDPDHYKVTAQRNGYKSKTIDVYLTPEEPNEYLDISLSPDIKSKTPLFIFFNFIRRFLS
jgi:hypothetical protein